MTTEKSSRNAKSGKGAPAPPSDSAKTNQKDERPQAAFVQRNNVDDGGGPKPRRLSFNVTKDGAIDWESMKDGNRKELKDTLTADTTLREMLGMLSKKDEEFEITEADVSEWIDWLNGGNKFATSIALAKVKKFQINPDILNAAYDLENCPASHFPNQRMPHPEPCKNCEKKKKIREELTKRGTRIANRYMGEWIKKHIDLVMFVTIYFKSVGQQAQMAIAMQYMRNQEEEKRQERESRAPQGRAASAD